MLIVAALLALLGAPAAGQSQRPPDHSKELAGIEQKTFLFVNSERTYRGLRELVWDDRLAAEARRHAANMASRWFFAHRDPVRGDLDVRLTRSSILWQKCAENLYQGIGVADPAREATLGWMRSHGHRENILDGQLVRAGVGAARRSDGTVFIAEVYIRPPQARPIP